jgi:hypothetical protein
MLRMMNWRDLLFGLPTTTFHGSVAPFQSLWAVKDLNFCCRDMNTIFLIAGQRATKSA